MNDTSKVNPKFKYNIRYNAFYAGVCSLVLLKLHHLLPDPLPKLYKSYINFGLGNYLTPLAEIKYYK